MRNRLRLALLACLAAAPAMAQEGDAVAGRVLAQRMCSSCHLVSADQPGPVPDGVPSFMAVAIATGSPASAMAVFISTPSAPSSMAIVESDAVPTPASTITGTRENSRMMRMLFTFWMPRPEPIGAPSGITAAAPASSSLRQTIGSSLV